MNRLPQIRPSESDLQRASIVELAAAAGELMAADTAESTRDAYQGAWERFTAFCTATGSEPLPAAPETASCYVAHLAQTGAAVSTIGKHMAAIAHQHRGRGLDSPTEHPAVGRTQAGIRRTLGTAAHGKAAISAEELARMAEGEPETLLGARNRALLLFGFAGAFRRSELVALDVADLAFVREGVTVTLRRSKTDQEGAGMVKAVPYASRPETCPVRALRAWLDAAGIAEGAVFRSVNRHGQLAGQRLTAQSVALVVKAAAARAGLDPAVVSGHSLRSGFCTSAAAAGVSERAIMAQTGHRSVTVMRRYIREGSLYRENAAAQLYGAVGW